MAEKVMCEFPQRSVLILPGWDCADGGAHHPTALESFIGWILKLDFFPPQKITLCLPGPDGPR